MILVCILVSIILMLSPISVCASDLADPVEPAPTFHGYEVLGYDDQGNAVLEYDDYIEYFNSCLQERAEGLEAGIIQPDAEPVPFSAYSVQPYDFLDDLDETKVVDKTRFIPKGDWISYALDFAKSMLEKPTMSAGSEITFTEKISTVGKQRLYYRNHDAYENITLGIDIDLDTYETSVRVTRSGFGALSTYYLTWQESTKISLTWKVDGMQLGIQNLSSVGANPSFTKDIYIYMISYAKNTLPVKDVYEMTVLPNNDTAILGNSTTWIKYATNTFASNSYSQSMNQQMINNTNNYWNPVVIYNQFPIKSGTTINQNNVSQYNEYGYTWNSTTNSIDFDPDILLSYIQNNLMPQLELAYKNAYQKFPDIDADVKDQDITYFDPFEQTETEPPETLPPATLPPGSGGGMTPGELDAVLNQESYYILDMETGLPPVTIDSLPGIENFPAELSSSAVSISGFVIDLFASSGLLPVFVSLSVLAFIVFTLKGG